MDNMLIVICCILCVAMIVVIQAYRKLDKLRFHARRLWPLLRDDMDEWIKQAAQLAAELEGEPELTARLSEVTGHYVSAKVPEEKAAAANEALRMCRLAEKDPEKLSIRARQLLVNMDELGGEMHSAVGYYNDGVKRMNKALERPILGVVGRWFGFNVTEELSDF